MDAIKLYINDIKDIQLLTQEEELKIAKAVSRGSAKAREELIRRNLRLVINIAKRYNGMGVSIIDLIEEGNLGLIKAVKKFNYKKGYRFSTYAAWWIRQYITRAVANQGKTVRVPVYMVEIISRWRKITEQLSQKLRRTPSVKEIAKKMKMPAKKVKEISEFATKISSLDAPIKSGHGYFIDFLQDEKIGTPSDEITEVFKHERLLCVMKQLSDREQEILNMRFGLKDDIPRTLNETAKKFKITRERVRQIECAAIKKLKNVLNREDI